MMRVGFLYLHHLHHVYHSAPIAYELAALAPDEVEVHLFSSSRGNTALLEDFAANYPGHNVEIHRLTAAPLYRLLRSSGRSYPKPAWIMARHAQTFNRMDAIVGTSFDTSWLFDKYGVSHPKFIFTFHGAGDRAYGFRKTVSDFDLLLLAGEKIRRRLDALGVLRDDNWAIVGYPKLDLLLHPHHAPDLGLPRDRLTVLYNPHWDRRLSSWMPWGRKILEYFAESDKYNLIFAPHLLLKEWKNRGLSLGQFARKPNIHIDMGSTALLDMTYTRMANIYLGDVSSQIYEFIVQPRPCIFLNSQGIHWEHDENYRHWHCGRVVDDLADLPEALASAESQFSTYRSTQQEMAAESFDNADDPAGRRAAKIILDWLRNRPHTDA